MESGMDLFIQLPEKEIKIIETKVVPDNVTDKKSYARPMEMADDAGEVAAKLTKESKKVFENASSLIFGIADNFKHQSRGKKNTPDEIEVEFSLMIGAGAKIVVVSGTAEAALKVRMKWNKE
jgi:metal-dependent hydrolase (beta-lactamase superfamily II)